MYVMPKGRGFEILFSHKKVWDMGEYLAKVLRRTLRSDQATKIKPKLLAMLSWLFWHNDFSGRVLRLSVYQ